MIYGDKQPPTLIAVEPKAIERELHKEGFFNHQLKIDVDGTDASTSCRATCSSIR